MQISSIPAKIAGQGAHIPRRAPYFLKTNAGILRTADAAQKFELKEEIAKAKARINELKGERAAGTAEQKIAPTRPIPRSWPSTPFWPAARSTSAS